ncbi:hypothetical protein Tco_1543122 [Tanacetum coccineum]
MIILATPGTADASPTRESRVKETYATITKEIRNKMDAKAEAVHIILTRIDNDIYSIVDACPNAKEMKFTSKDGESLESYYSRFYKMMNELVQNQCIIDNNHVNVQFLLQLEPEWQRFVTIVKQSQDLKNVSYHKLFDILKQPQNEVNEIRTERQARNTNPLALIAATQQPFHNPRPVPAYYTQTSTNRSPATTRSKGKEIAKAPFPLSQIMKLLVMKKRLQGTTKFRS